MLAMRSNWAFPIGVSVFKKRGTGKLGLVELRRAGSAGKRVPNKKKQYSYGIGLGGLMQRRILFVSKGLWAENYVFLKLTRAPMSQF